MFIRKLIGLICVILTIAVVCLSGCMEKSSEDTSAKVSEKSSETTPVNSILVKHYPEYYKAEQNPDRVYLVLNMEIKNNGYPEISIGPEVFDVVIAGVVYSHDPVTYALEKSGMAPLDNVELRNGGKTSGCLVFEIPDDKTGASYTIEYSGLEDYKFVYEIVPRPKPGITQEQLNENKIKADYEGPVTTSYDSSKNSYMHTIESGAYTFIWNSPEEDLNHWVSYEYKGGEHNGGLIVNYITNGTSESEPISLTILVNSHSTSLVADLRYDRPSNANLDTYFWDNWDFGNTDNKTPENVRINGLNGLLLYQETTGNWAAKFFLGKYAEVGIIGNDVSVWNKDAFVSMLKDMELKSKVG